MMKVTAAGMRVLRGAAARDGGYACPTSGLRGNAQTVVLERLQAGGLLTREPAPRLTEEGRRVAAGLP